jgi:hypothetical protein
MQAGALLYGWLRKKQFDGGLPPLVKIVGGLGGDGGEAEGGYFVGLEVDDAVLDLHFSGDASTRTLDDG